MLNSARGVLSSARERASPRVVRTSPRRASQKDSYAKLDQEEADADHVDTTDSEEAAFTPRKLQLAFARTTIGIAQREAGGGTCTVEESVYGAALVMPQLARTVGWNKTMTSLTVQTWMFLLFNIILQAYLLRMLAKEEIVMDGFAGQMFLCDFGAYIENCPGVGCRGPGGTQVTAPRLYSWDLIVARNFVKDSLKAIFPDKLDDINALIDAGEYGLESYWCRVTCCLIFMISCMGEMALTIKTVQLLYKIPNKAEAWILPREETYLDKCDSPLQGEIDEVRIRVAGMPPFWKVLSLVVVVIPKIMLWKLTTETGITILMETSGIEDIVTNSVSLTFILSIDELIATSLMSEVSIDLVRAIEGFELFDKHASEIGDMSLLTDDELLERYERVERSLWNWSKQHLFNLMPMKLIYSLLGTAIFVFEYYWKHCTPNSQDGGRLVSKTMFTPKHVDYGWLNAFLPFFFPVEYEDRPYWTTPDEIN